jgi:hypothetical protein
MRVKTLYTLLQSTRLESQLANEDMESTIQLSETVSTVYNFREKSGGGVEHLRLEHRDIFVRRERRVKP